MNWGGGVRESGAICRLIPGLPAWAIKDILSATAVYLITLHAYRSWGPEKARGFVRKGTDILPTNDEMARMYDGQAGCRYFHD
jgi:hypothetical protein